MGIKIVPEQFVIGIAFFFTDHHVPISVSLSSLETAQINWAPSSEFVSSSIPSWQISTAHAQPFRGARDLAFCLQVPLDSLLVWASSGGSGETARMRRLAWTFAARICDKYQIRLTQSNLWYCWQITTSQSNHPWIHRLEPPHDKTNIMNVHPAKTQISLGNCPVRSESSLYTGPKLSSSRQRRLIRQDGCLGWSESSLGAHAILLVFVMRRLTFYFLSNLSCDGILINSACEK